MPDRCVTAQTDCQRAPIWPGCETGAGSSKDAELQLEKVMNDDTADGTLKTPERTVEKPDGTPSTETGKKRKARASK